VEVLAQFITNIFAFLLLLAILKKFAWKGLIDAIDARTEKIESGFKSIEDGQQELEQLKAKYEASLARIEDEARTKIQEAAAQGRQLAVEIEEEARAHARETFEKTKESVALEVAKARTELKEQIVDMAIQVNHKILSRYLDESTDQKMIDGFVQEIDRLGSGSSN